MTATATKQTANGTGEQPVGAEVGSPVPDTRNLWQRLRDVKVELGGTIEKGGTAPAVMGGFGFIEWDDVAERIGILLAQHGVMPFPSMTEHSNEHIGDTSTGKPIYRASVTLTLELVNVDNPEDRAILSWPGTGDDGSDKSVQKAGTSAEKYALLKLFMLKGEKGATDTEAGADAVAAPRGGTASPRPNPQPAADADLCEQCQLAGYRNKRGYPPKYWPSRRLGKPDQCDGVDAEGDYQNHIRKPALLPALSGVGAAVERHVDESTPDDGPPLFGEGQS